MTAGGLMFAAEGLAAPQLAESRAHETAAESPVYIRSVAPGNRLLGSQRDARNWAKAGATGYSARSKIRTPAFRRSARALGIVRPVAATTSVPAGGVRRVLPRDCASQGRRPHGPDRRALVYAARGVRRTASRCCVSSVGEERRRVGRSCVRSCRLCGAHSSTIACAASVGSEAASPPSRPEENDPRRRDSRIDWPRREPSQPESRAGGTRDRSEAD